MRLQGEVTEVGSRPEGQKFRSEGVSSFRSDEGELSYILQPFDSQLLNLLTPQLINSSTLMNTNIPPKHQVRTAGATAFSAVRIFFLSLFLLLSGGSVRAQVDAEMVTIMGRNALSVDDYLTAIRYFNQAIEAKPFLSRPYYYRAYAKFTLEDYTGAAADCDRSIELNPFIVEVYQLRALCRIHNEDFTGAVSDYTRTLRELPDEQGARYNRALCYLQLKEYPQANADLDYMLQRWPKYYRTYMIKAQVALEQKDTVGGMRWVDSLLVKNPKEAAAWSFKGRYELSREHYALADSCLTQALLLQPKDFELYVSRAQALHALGRFGQAIADYDQAIQLQPQHFVAHYNRGLLRSFVGDLNRAIKDFDFVLSIEPDNTLAIYNRAQLRAQVGDFRGAIADYTTLIKEYPQFSYGYLARAECRRKIGDVKGAVADETWVARRNLDLAYGKAKPTKGKKVRLRSEHALEQYQQLVAEDPDTVRNVFGTLYGKVQNEKVGSDLLPMYALSFRPVFTKGYHSIGFLPEVAKFVSAKSEGRKLCLTAEADATAASDADHDARHLESKMPQWSLLEQTLVRSAIAAARYDYTSALNEANQAVRADSTSLVARMQRASILARSVASSTLAPDEAKARLALATADLRQAESFSPQSAYVAYNQGCLLAQQKLTTEALEAFTRAIRLDSRLAEAYYNRAMLYLHQDQRDKAVSDFSRAGQLGLYKAYAQLKAMQEAKGK